MDPNPTILPDPPADKTAVILYEDGTRRSYGELRACAHRLGHLFRARGFGIGDGIAFCIENRLEFFDVCVAAQRAGLYYTAISTYLTTNEIDYIVSDCGAKLFILSAALRQHGDALARSLDPGIQRFSIGGDIPGYEPLEPLLDNYPVALLPDATAGQDLLYSSGTTGRPKGIRIPLSGRSIGELAPSAQGPIGLYRFSSETVYLSPAPLYHAAPLRFNLLVLALGGTSVVLRHFDPVNALAAIDRYRCTHSQWVPTMFIRMLKLPAEVRSRYALGSLRVAIHAAAPCPVPVKRQMLDWWGPVIHEYYAGSENNGMCAITPEEWLQHPGSVGRALYGELHIVDDDGRELGPNETGTVYFSGGNEFAYLNDPEKTRSAHNDRGWSTLGDIGHVDEDGYLYLTDRKAHMIISGGVNVYPQEIENLLVTHPCVADVAVFGIPDEDLGEQVKAVVQPAQSATAGPQLRQELADFCRRHLSSIKCPRSIDFCDSLPRHPTGKLYKRLLKEKYRRADIAR